MESAPGTGIDRAQPKSCTREGRAIDPTCRLRPVMKPSSEGTNHATILDYARACVQQFDRLIGNICVCSRCDECGGGQSGDRLEQDSIDHRSYQACTAGDHSLDTQLCAVACGDL